MGITIGNVTYHGNNISIINGRVIIDGKDVTPDGKQITINVTGDIQELNVDSCDKVTVTGNVGSLKTSTGDVEVDGNVGSLNTSTGDVEVNGNVEGDLESQNGDISCQNVGGSVSTKNGDIKYRKK